MIGAFRPDVEFAGIRPAARKPLHGGGW